MNNLTGLLTTAHGAVPLTGVRIEGDLVGRGAKIIVQQKYHNTEKNPIEAVYKFPLPEGSAIAGFRIWIGDRLIKGAVEERDTAFDKYDDALAQGDGAYLMDEERPNIFTLSVGNLNPDMEVTIEIELVMILDPEGQKHRLTLPTSISPRYVPADMPDEDGIPVNDIIHPVYAPSVPYGMSMSLKIHHKENLVAVESPSHPVRVLMESGLTTVELTNETTQMDRDFILLVDPGKDNSGKVYQMNYDEHTFLQLDLFLPEPETDKKSDPGEVIFLLDCSGSMAGGSIQEAKKALEICLKALPEKCTFNVYRFGSKFNSFFTEPQLYSEISLAMALRKLELTDADLGGTEMYRPFKDIYRTVPGKGGRSIVMLTDGEVGNEKKLMDLVSSHRTNTRVYAIGIGHGPNEHLIKGLARAGNGAAEFVYPGERIEPKVLRIFSRLSGPNLDDIRIVWPGDDIEQVPDQPAIFTGQVVTIFARSQDKTVDQSQIKILGTLGKKQMEWVYDIENVSSENMPLPQLWAREKIRDLEESSAEIGSRQQRRKEIRFSDQIIQISKTYGILSSLTSYLGIETRISKDKTTEPSELRKVPTLVTTGWHGEVHFMASAIFDRDPSDVDYAAPVGAVFAKMDIPENRVFRSGKSIKFRKMVFKPDQTDLLMTLLTAQQPSGGFLIDKKLSRLVGINLKLIKKQAEQLKTKGLDDAFLILCTVLIFEILQIHFSGELNVWQPVTEKSRKWLDNISMNEMTEETRQEITIWANNFVMDNVKIGVIN